MRAEPLDHDASKMSVIEGAFAHFPGAFWRFSVTFRSLFSAGSQVRGEPEKGGGLFRFFFYRSPGVRSALKGSSGGIYKPGGQLVTGLRFDWGERIGARPGWGT
jgi:hypothetical protein